MSTSKSKLLSRLAALRDNAYLVCIDASSDTACLGEEAKIKHGEFGGRELAAHRKSAEWLGKYRAYAHVISILNDPS